MRKATVVLLSVGSVWMCLVCICAYLSLYRPGLATRWRDEPPPPEPLMGLTLGEAGEIIGSASDGTLYEFHYGNYRSPSAWSEVDAPTGNSAISAQGCSPGDGNRIILPPPGKIRSRVREDCVYIESAYHLEVALLENGDIWSWEHERYAYTELFLMFFMFIGCGVGALILLTGTGMAIYQQFKKTS